MGRCLRPTAVLFAVLSLVTGVVYPLAVTAVAQVALPGQANGSMVARGGTALGSRLVGQPFGDPRYFWGRPSATLPVPYCAQSSSGSNLGPTNPALRSVVESRIVALRRAGPANPEPIPADLVTSSGSGLDPHISPAAAAYQVARVARARAMDPRSVAALVARHVEGRQFGILGEPRVNVLRLNLALDGER